MKISRMELEKGAKFMDFRGVNVHSGPKRVKNVEVEGDNSIWGEFYRFLSNFRVKK